MAVHVEQDPAESDGAAPGSVGPSNEVNELTRLHERFRRHLYLPDPALIDFVMAAYVAACLGTDPVWPLVVAPPSSGKTEVIQAVSELDGAYTLSSLTSKTLISGKLPKQGDPDPSLLMRLPRAHALLVLKDFTTVLTMRDDERNEILGQLREIYDGEFKKDFGTGHTVSWTGRLGFLAGVTQAIDAHHVVLNLLGDRFIYFRVPEVDRRQVANTATYMDRGQIMRADLKAAASDFLDSLRSWAQVPDLEDRGVREQLVSLADITTWTRTAVYRDKYTRDIEVAPALEGPARFAKQLVALWKALETMSHPNTMSLVSRVALDSMPPARSAVLRAIGPGIRDTNELREATKLSKSAHRHVLEDMEALGVLEQVERGGSHRAAQWTLSEQAREAWSRAFPHLYGFLNTPPRGEKEKSSRGAYGALAKPYFAELISEGAE